MKLIAEYLEHAVHFERMAAGEANADLKNALLGQAEAYRKLAAERAERQKPSGPPRPDGQ